MNKKIVHIGQCDKFIPPFIEFMKDNFDFRQHIFFFTPSVADKELKLESNIHLSKPGRLHKLKHYYNLIIKMHTADKIVLHSLFNFSIVIMLFFMPWLLKKCCWVMWGADLYIYTIGKRDWKWRYREFFRRPVIKNIGYFSTTVPGDYDLAKEWYSIKSKWIHNLMYPSHIYRDPELIPIKKQTKQESYIQVGNSADPSNNHYAIVDILQEYNNIKVFFPLAYGSEKYKNALIKYARKKLGERFVPILDYMTFDDYNSYMATVDIAVFNHNRQQGMGNIIGLLSLGKKVVMRKDITPYKFFTELGLVIASIEECDFLEPLSSDDAINNKKIMKDYFNTERLKSNWQDVFDG